MDSSGSVMIQLLLSIGTQHSSYLAAGRTKLTNLIGLGAFVLATLHTLCYVTIIVHPTAALINSLFSLAYPLTLLWNYLRLPKFSKIWLFLILILHLFVCTNVYMDNRLDFHMYYYLIPIGVFLLFDSKDQKEKISLSLLALFFYIYCEITPNTDPMLQLSDQTNHIIFQSVMLASTLILVIVMISFNHYIELNEYSLKHQASTDSLTGLTNHSTFYKQGTELLKQHQINLAPFSVIIFDLDHFKGVNDNYGHLIGDLCLKEVCKVVKRYCRSQDIFARIGGEEFALILPSSSLEDTKAIAERMRIAVENHAIVFNEALTLKCTASFGVSMKLSEDESLEDIVMRADRALYSAKKSGRNRIDYDIQVTASNMNTL